MTREGVYHSGSQPQPLPAMVLKEYAAGIMDSTDPRAADTQHVLAVHQLRGADALSLQLAQELYDPSGRLTDPEMAPHLADFTEFVLNTYGVKAPEELLPALLCDAAESGIDQDGLLERASVFGEEKLATISLRSVTELAQQQATDIIERIGTNTPADKKTLVASDLIAREAYAGKKRKSGSPYYSHPQQVAAMTLHVFDQLETEGFTIEPQFKDAVISVDLLHDATEETVRSCKYYDPGRPEGFSPLLVREVFKQTDNPHGKIVANSLRLMTHYAHQPWAPTYPRYVLLGSSDFIFCLAKSPDMWHNLRIDPKPITNPGDEKKIRAKQEMYRAGFELLSVSAPQRTGNSRNAAWSRRYFDILRTIAPEDVPPMVGALDEYIYGVKK